MEGRLTLPVGWSVESAVSNEKRLTEREVVFNLGVSWNIFFFFYIAVSKITVQNDWQSFQNTIVLTYHSWSPRDRACRETWDLGASACMFPVP